MRCGQLHPPKQCPAKGDKCRTCGKKNHWARVCIAGRQGGHDGYRDPRPKGRPNSKGRQQSRSPGRSLSRERGSTQRSSGHGGNQGQKYRGGNNPTYELTVQQRAAESQQEGTTGKAPCRTPTHSQSELNVEGEERSKFACYAVDKDEGLDPRDQIYTDTDREGRTECITDITVRHSSEDKPVSMTVKADPGAMTDIIPLYLFQKYFPQLCDSDGNPKEGIMTESDASFTMYGGTAHERSMGMLFLQGYNEEERCWHPLRFHIVKLQGAPILIGYAHCGWLSLNLTKCKNKAPRNTFRVAEITSTTAEPATETLGGCEGPASEETAGLASTVSNIISGPPHTHKETTASRAKRRRRKKSNYSTIRDTPNEDLSTREQPHSSNTPSTAEPRSPETLGGCGGPERNTLDETALQKASLLGYWTPDGQFETWQRISPTQARSNLYPEKVQTFSKTTELKASRYQPFYYIPGSLIINTNEEAAYYYPNTFDRLGDLAGQYDIKTDPMVVPVQNARRKVPIELVDRIDDALDYMLANGIIVEERDPTPWVNSMTYPQKPDGSVRPCLDPRNLNRAIIRECHKAPTVEEISHLLSGAVCFTKADANKAFLQLHLTKEASLKTTFSTHRGRFRFLRMPFGLKMSQDVFQLKMDDIMIQCPGSLSIHDDIVVYGKDTPQHDSNLVNMLNVASKEGLSMNKDKLDLRQEKISFFGADFTKEGMLPDPKKVQGITELSPPVDKQACQSFLGLVTYMGNFIPHLSHNTQYLRDMLKKDAVYQLDVTANAAFQHIKKLLVKAMKRPLRYYDRNLPVVVQADASMRGLGAVLVQEGRPIAFASKSLTDTEKRYANIEREMLAIVFAVLRFSIYLLGRPFIVESDHRPLEMIQLKNLALAPKRLQGMLIKIQRYDMTIKYRPGREMLLADGLSRCPSPDNTTAETTLPYQVHAVALTAGDSARLSRHTMEDPILKTVAQLCINGWPSSRSRVPRIARRYWDFRDELSAEKLWEGVVVLKGLRYCIPVALREEYLAELHKGHLSVNKQADQARSSIYWPGIDGDIEDYTKRCTQCLLHSQTRKEPLRPSEIPAGPWKTLGADHFELRGKLYLLIADYFSKYPYVFPVTTTSYKATKRCFEELFAAEGRPDELRSDNGTPFQSNEFNLFMKANKIQHITSSPLYPRSNGFIERMVQTIKNSFSKALNRGEPTTTALFNYRSTPIGPNLPAPAEILHGRNPVTGKVSHIDVDAIHEHLRARQAKYKENHDKSRAAHSQRPLQVGESCYYMAKANTWQPCTILQAGETDRDYIVTTSDNKTFRRNRDHIKPMNPEPLLLHPSNKPTPAKVPKKTRNTDQNKENLWEGVVVLKGQNTNKTNENSKKEGVVVLKGKKKYNKDALWQFPTPPLRPALRRNTIKKVQLPTPTENPDHDTQPPPETSDTPVSQPSTTAALPTSSSSTSAEEEERANYEHTVTGPLDQDATTSAHQEEPPRNSHITESQTAHQQQQEEEHGESNDHPRTSTGSSSETASSSDESDNTPSTGSRASTGSTSSDGSTSSSGSTSNSSSGSSSTSSSDSEGPSDGAKPTEGTPSIPSKSHPGSQPSSTANTPRTLDLSIGSKIELVEHLQPAGTRVTRKVRQDTMDALDMAGARGRIGLLAQISRRPEYQPTPRRNATPPPPPRKGKGKGVGKGSSNNIQPRQILQSDSEPDQQHTPSDKKKKAKRAKKQPSQKDSPDSDKKQE